MATKGKTRGPKENKHVKKAAKGDPKFQTKSKRVEKHVGADRKP